MTFRSIKPKWYMGIGVFLLVIIFLLFVAAPLQQRLGMWGLAITELVLLIFALIPIFLFKWKLRDIIPIKLIQLKQLIAILLFFCATYFVVNTISVITSYFFPESIQVSTYMVNFYSSVPLPLAVFIMAVMPGICEEVLHRGFILHTLEGGKNDLVTMILTAVIFGVFHLDLYRFLPTAVIGFVLTYIMIKTKNFLLPVIFHFINNAITVVASYNADGNQSAVITRTTIGVFLVLSTLSPFLFYIANKILTNDDNKNKKKVKCIVIALTILLGVSGGYVISSPNDMKPVFNISFSEDVNYVKPPKIFDNIIIEKDFNYDLSVSIKDKNHMVITTVKVEDENGVLVWKLTGSEFFANKSTFLKAGIYKVTFSYDCQEEQAAAVDINFGIKLIE